MYNQTRKNGAQRTQTPQKQILKLYTAVAIRRGFAYEILRSKAVCRFDNVRTFYRTMQWHHLVATWTTSYVLELKVFLPSLRSGSCPKFNGFFPIILSVILSTFTKVGPLVFELSCYQTNRQTDKRCPSKRTDGGDYITQITLRSHYAKSEVIMTTDNGDRGSKRKSRWSFRQNFEETRGSGDAFDFSRHHFPETAVNILFVVEIAATPLLITWFRRVCAWFLWRLACSPGHKFFIFRFHYC